ILSAKEGAPVATGPITSQAIAYLKPDLTSQPRAKEPPRRRVELSGLDAPVLRPLAEGLLVASVVDRDDQLEFVLHRHLAAEGCSEEELPAVGVENLARQAAGSLEVATHPCGEMFAVLMGGNFEASLMVLDAVWEEGFRQFVAGEYVVACPARDLLGFCDATSAVGVRELRAVCAKMQAGGVDHPLSNQLYRRVGGRWQVLPAEPDAAADRSGCSGSSESGGHSSRPGG